jgi:hypothetical protein
MKTMTQTVELVTETERTGRRYFVKTYTLECGHVETRVEPKGAFAAAQRIKCGLCGK